MEAAKVSAIILGCLLFLVLFGLVRLYLVKTLHYLMDYSTGFLKMKARLAKNQEVKLWGLEEELKETGPYSRFRLDIGKTEVSAFNEVLTVPGKYRQTHTYVVGASGSGKSSLLLNLIEQDFKSGLGLCLIDPHGDLVKALVPLLGGRAEHTVILDLSDEAHLVSYNPLERRAGVSVAEQTGKLLLAFKRIWEDSWGARMEDIMRHTLSLLIEQEYTLAEFPKLLNDADFRAMLLAQTKLGQAHEFFTERYNKWDQRTRIERTESSLNKISAFLSDERIGLPLAQPKSSFNVRELMDSGGVLLVNLAKGHLAGNADLFGALLMADIETAFLSRKPHERNPFALYVDEFQNIATESFSTFLAEARKFGLCLTLAHQTTKQLDDKLLALILGNAQTQIYFRVSREDAERFAKESANMVAEIEAQNDVGLIQDGERPKLALQEMWEVAYHQLTRLKARQAFVMVKGALEQPELIVTLDNPSYKSASKFGYALDTYSDVAALQAQQDDRRSVIELLIEDFRKRDADLTPKQTEPEPKSSSTEPAAQKPDKPKSGPDDLDFLDGAVPPTPTHQD